MSDFSVNRLSTQADDFWQQLDALTAWSEERDVEVGERVASIIRAIRERGDDALVEFTNQFDQRQVTQAQQLVVEHEALTAALAKIPQEQRYALEEAAKRVRAYHEHQRQPSGRFEVKNATLLAQQLIPLDNLVLFWPVVK